MNEDLIGADSGNSARFQALRVQRMLAAALLDQIEQERRRFNVEPGAGADWISPAQREYGRRRVELRGDLDLAAWCVRGGVRALTVAIAEMTARG